MVHRLIEKKDGQFEVDRAKGSWGETIEDVIEAIGSDVLKKHGTPLEILPWFAESSVSFRPGVVGLLTFQRQT